MKTFVNERMAFSGRKTLSNDPFDDSVDKYDFEVLYNPWSGVHVVDKTCKLVYQHWMMEVLQGLYLLHDWVCQCQVGFLQR